MENEEPLEIIEAASSAVLNLLPNKSRKLYDAAYNRFREWCVEKSTHLYRERFASVF
jgi:hypothetical protein